MRFGRPKIYGYDTSIAQYSKFGLIFQKQGGTAKFGDGFNRQQARK